jgi:hypothetical protein
MLSNLTTRDTPGITTVRGRLRVQVPWDRAEEWQTRLRRQGIPTTLQLDPVWRESHLEAWPGADAGRLQAALQQLGA